MRKRHPPTELATWYLLTLLLACALPVAAAEREECERQFKPQTGQPGKDVIWVPTNDGLVARMLQMAKVTKADRVYDLGAGDGKIAIAAARDFGAQAVGVEYDPQLAKLAQCYVEADRLGERVRIVHGDIFETDFSSATVVTLYLLPELNLRLRPTILDMKPGTRVVSHSFLMDDWEPDERSMTEDGSAYLWIVPAKVGGAWSFREADGKGSFDVQLQQKFQQLSGRAAGEPLVSESHVHGADIELAFVENGAPTRVTGRVDGNRIDAKVTRGNKASRYIGTRTQAGSGR
ncbi:MAG TPA: methyltransferase domain-containing protein [Steroidobacteraceae bacterium]|nr:methyltransferase domain-containing protein [Steroidobacteraceae bacterium]